MYTNPVFLKRVRHRVLVEGASLRSTALTYRISRHTLRSILSDTKPRKYVRASRKSSIDASATPRKSPAKIHGRTVAAVQRRRDAFEWMHRVLQKDVPAVLGIRTDDRPDLERILRQLYRGLSARNRAMAVLAQLHGIKREISAEFLGINRKTIRKYLSIYEQGGTELLFRKQRRRCAKAGDEQLKRCLFSLLHEPPSNYGINRTSWKLHDLCQILGTKGFAISGGTIHKIVHAAGYRWRQARVVLTSNDPEYSEKLHNIQSILSSLRDDEAFFSIDEFGPFAIKMKPGRSLVGPGEQPVVPQWQKSRGCLIVTASLELAGNQVTHFYSTKKNTAEMIRMMEVLVDQYRDKRRIYLSWDAASWHISKKLKNCIAAHNASAVGRPLVALAPLPARAQFLNVIESIFSGMARAIIHNSNYASLDAAKSAIDRYFTERNEQFRRHPHRAGQKIWGQERELPRFSQSNNCKDPAYMQSSWRSGMHRRCGSSNTSRTNELLI